MDQLSIFRNGFCNPLSNLCISIIWPLYFRSLVQIYLSLLVVKYFLSNLHHGDVYLDILAQLDQYQAKAS